MQFAKRRDIRLCFCAVCQRLYGSFRLAQEGAPANGDQASCSGKTAGVSKVTIELKEAKAADRHEQEQAHKLAALKKALAD